MASSVKQRLLNRAKEQGEDFNFLLSRFAAERFLFRLGESKHGKDFVLKGAMLFHLRSSQVPHRATRDLDLLGTGDPDIVRMQRLFQEVCRTKVPDDGLTFVPDSVKGELIREAVEYPGIRLRLDVRMGAARIPLHVDVGFGDAITPAPKEEKLVTLLDFPPPLVRVYPWEIVIAEKFQAIVELGMDNSRMKDYFDLYYLAKSQVFNGSLLARAIQAVFTRRKTPLPDETPVGLLPTFGKDTVKQMQWRAFVRKLEMEKDALALSDIIAGLHGFLIPPVKALLNKDAFAKTWMPGGPWK